MQLRSEDVIARATDRQTDNLPTNDEVKLAGDNIKLVILFRKLKQAMQKHNAHVSEIFLEAGVR